MLGEEISRKYKNWLRRLFDKGRKKELRRDRSSERSIKF
jgi:hypothetical protein